MNYRNAKKQLEEAPLTPAEMLTRHMEEHHMRRTPERYAILEQVEKMSKHFTIDALYEAMEAIGYHVSRATLYATMRLLEAASIVRRHQFAGQPARFELTIDRVNANHQHLVCTQCGKVREIKDPALARSLAARRYPSFSARYFQFYVYGVCSICARRRKKNAQKTT